MSLWGGEGERIRGGKPGGEEGAASTTLLPTTISEFQHPIVTLANIEAERLE